MRVLRHLVLGALAVLLGAGAAQYALKASADPAPRASTPSPSVEQPIPERVELPAEPQVEPEAEGPGVDLPSCDGPDSAACTEVAGRVLYVEGVDPDGDGDLHVVVFDPRGISAPAATSIDVRPGLRPAEDPRVGQRVAAAGPVQRGSFGQDQIHALEFVVVG